MPALYVVATPIGHPDDITLRALQVLRTVDHVCAEDTRVTGQLLAHHGIQARLTSIREHNELAGAELVSRLLALGSSVAYVSDAGTPAVSDPGVRLVAAVRAAGHRVLPIPGASALTAAMSVAGMAGSFTFVGFLPAKGSERSQMLKAIARSPHISVLYEAPHRLLQTVDDLCASLGDSHPICLAKELTKSFETIINGSLSHIKTWLLEDSNRQRGEFVLLLGPVAEAASQTVDAKTLLSQLLSELPPSKAAKIAAKILGQDRQSLYELAETLKK